MVFENGHVHLDNSKPPGAGVHWLNFVLIGLFLGFVLGYVFGATIYFRRGREFEANQPVRIKAPGFELDLPKQQEK